jgi:carbon-monoxide dehydrogenase small subunit
MILGAYAFLLKNPRARRSEIVAAMDAHLCRCGAHGRILQAVESAAAAMARTRWSER